MTHAILRAGGPGPAGPFPRRRPGQLPRPDQPCWPEPPAWPAQPSWPAAPEVPEPPVPGREGADPVRVWLDPGSAALQERLLAQRIVLAQGQLDDEAATRLCAQLLTLDAESTEPVRLDLQGLSAGLGAAITVMGVLDTLRVTVTASVAGRLGGPAVGVLAACGRRRGYPNAVLELSEPRLSLHGPASVLAAREGQARLLLDALWERVAEATGREADEIRADAARHRFLTVPQAIEYGLLTEQPAVRGTAAGPR